MIEQLFSLPGIGRMLVADVSARDLPKVQGELLVLTGFVLIVGFVVDLVHRADRPPAAGGVMTDPPASDGRAAEERRTAVALEWLRRLWACPPAASGSSW